MPQPLHILRQRTDLWRSSVSHTHTSLSEKSRPFSPINPRLLSSSDHIGRGHNRALCPTSCRAGSVRASACGCSSAQASQTGRCCRQSPADQTDCGRNQFCDPASRLSISTCARNYGRPVGRVGQAGRDRGPSSRAASGCDRAIMYASHRANSTHTHACGRLTAAAVQAALGATITGPFSQLIANDIFVLSLYHACTYLPTCLPTLLRHIYPHAWGTGSTIKVGKHLMGRITCYN